MKVKDFTDHPEVSKSINRLKDYWTKKRKEVSDILDPKGNQYVDLVMEGGGVLGIALVGYTYALESVGIRFLGLGGTSAGAINTLLIAALDKPDSKKSGKCLKALSALNMMDFVDGDSDARDFIENMVRKAGSSKMVWKGMQVIDNLTEDLGLNPGDAFEKWVEDVLEKAGVLTLADLDVIMAPPDLHTRDGKPLSKKKAGSHLALVSAEVSTETKVVFPGMADLFWSRPRTVNPAKFVRASMSIPYFFHPFRIGNVPQGDTAAKKWDQKAGYTGVLPNTATFVDGGIVSNFPIDIFHGSGVPLAPTFGAKLGVDRTKSRNIQNPLSLLGAVFNSARHCADYDFLIKNRDYRKLVAFIPTGNHNWLDFFLKDEAKVDLFARGVRTAADFLIKFNWKAYKDIREMISH
jgi:NTE family protein